MVEKAKALEEIDMKIASVDSRVAPLKVMPLPFFTYGSLMKGMWNHDLMEGAHPWGPTAGETQIYTKGDWHLLIFQPGVPGIMKGGKEFVRGELWFNAPMTKLDAGMEKRYVRRCIDILVKDNLGITSVKAWAYIIEDPTVAKGGMQLVNGDYRAHMLDRAMFPFRNV